MRRQNSRRFKQHPNTRTPHEPIHHTDSVLEYSRTVPVGGEYRPPLLADFAQTVLHSHATLADLARDLERGTEFRGIAAEALLQGPFSDTMIHAGQLAMLRRLAGSALLPQNLIFARICPGRLGPDQPVPASPDTDWQQRP